MFLTTCIIIPARSYFVNVFFEFFQNYLYKFPAGSCIRILGRRAVRLELPPHLFRRVSGAGRPACQSLAEFANATGGRLDSARTSVPKFGRSEGSKAAWAAKITPNDFKISRGIGARAKNYVVVDKSTGEEYYFVEGTRTQNAQVFAGKGGVNPLREEVAQGLSDEFGGKPEDWQHCKAKGWLDVDGEAVKAEVHWFQNGSEKVKFKVKRWLYDED